MDLKYIPCGRTSCDWTPVRMLDGSGYTYLHTDGHLMIHRFKEVSPFDNKMAIVRVFGVDEEQNLTYVSDEGNIVPVLFDDVYPFLKGESQAAAYIGDVKYLVTQDGLVYRFKTHLTESLKKADKNSRGVIFNLGKGKRFELIYDIIAQPECNMLPVRMKDGSGYTYVNIDGYEIMNHRFKNIAPFKKEPITQKAFAMVKDRYDRVSFVDKQGLFYDKEDILDEMIEKQLIQRLNKAKKNGQLDEVVKQILEELDLPLDLLDEMNLENIDEVVDYIMELEHEDDGSNNEEYDDEMEK